jgi:hypothetical protein
MSGESVFVVGVCLASFTNSTLSPRDRTLRFAASASLAFRFVNLGSEKSMIIELPASGLSLSLSGLVSVSPIAPDIKSSDKGAYKPSHGLLLAENSH